MKTTDRNPIQKADRLAMFAEGIGTGLLIAFIISSFGHPLPDAVLYAAFGIMLVAAWIPVMARRWKLRVSGR